MKQAASANLEMTIVLPLGVVANQLIKIEADLRLLNVKALSLVPDAQNEYPVERVAVTLAIINEALDSIKSFISDIEGNVHARSTTVSVARSSPDAVYRKPYPELDD
jgi:hypothetical protein